uniref:Putative transposase n=1 Tax=Amblyomma sculptum TaxID=1581419 RepID=A0A1E1XP67_AMBSC
MGGVDRFDQKRNAYPVDRRSKKGWHRIFYFLLDAAIVNAFVQHTALEHAENLDFLHFKLILGRQLIQRQSFRAGRKSRGDFQRKNGRKSGALMTGVPAEIRFQGKDHFPKASGTRRRCRWCSTKRSEVRTKLLCGACNVPLCTDCFSPFHSNR